MDFIPFFFSIFKKKMKIRMNAKTTSFLSLLDRSEEKKKRNERKWKWIFSLKFFKKIFYKKKFLFCLFFQIFHTKIKTKELREEKTKETRKENEFIKKRSFSRHLHEEAEFFLNNNWPKNFNKKKMETKSEDAIHKLRLKINDSVGDFFLLFFENLKIFL